jgi:hypothetical protein
MSALTLTSSFLLLLLVAPLSTPSLAALSVSLAENKGSPINKQYLLMAPAVTDSNTSFTVALAADLTALTNDSDKVGKGMVRRR